MHNDDTLLAIAYLTTIRAFGVWRWKQYKYSRKSFLRWRKKHRTHNRCDICTRTILPDDPLGTVTIDHIIPRSIFLDLELFALEFHYSNFRVAHEMCNSQRGEITTIDQLPPSQQRKIMLALRDDKFRTLEGINKVDMTHGFKDMPSKESIRRRVKITICHDDENQTITAIEAAASASPTSDSAILATV